VTSVAASVPTFLSVAGSPITTSGTLAITLSGTALPTANGGTNLTSFTSGGVVYASSTSALATGSALVFDGTNVGIGTASPAKKLDVTGTGRFTGELTLENDVALTNSAYVYSSNGGGVRAGFFLDGANTLVKTFTAGVERMRVDATGIVTMSAYGAGTATFSAAGVISSVSDETWKIKDGVPTNTDAMLQKLEPGYWFYTDEKKDTFGADRQLGFYAQNVHAAIGKEAAPIPEKYKDIDGNDTDVSKPWGYYDRSVLAVTVMSLKNALSTIEKLKARLTALENR
jgi:hypothetical protein